MSGLMTRLTKTSITEPAIIVKTSPWQVLGPSPLLPGDKKYRSRQNRVTAIELARPFTRCF